VLGFHEARERLLARARRLEPERISLALALGRVLTEPVSAPFDVPPFSYSAMDGYVLCAESLAGSGPFALRVLGESRTGRAPDALVPGTAARIFTGAEIPAGADTVIAQEDVERQDDAIVVRAAPRAGQHVRRAGEDLARGGEALGSGKRLGPADLALLASLDAIEVVVARRPRVTLLATGDELRAPGAPPRSGSIPDSLTLPLSALASASGAEVRVAPFVRDDADTTAAAVASALRGSDVLVTVGGVSVGDHDRVRPALEASGVVLDFWKVAIKPGKPLASGVHAPSGALVLALPGNPASALVTFSLFGVPLLRALQGDRNPLPRAVFRPLSAPYRKKAGRLEFVRAVLEDGPDGPVVRPLDNQASGALTSLAWADALAAIPAEVEALEAGETVEVVRFQDL
jgi:molybdopterin molybdotransferase